MITLDYDRWWTQARTEMTLPYRAFSSMSLPMQNAIKKAIIYHRLHGGMVNGPCEFTPRCALHDAEGFEAMMPHHCLKSGT